MKIYHVIQTKCKQLRNMSTWSSTCRQSVFKWHQSNKIFLRVLPTRWRQKLTGIDKERNYVTHPMYCDQRVCRPTSVCLSVRVSQKDSSKPNFTKFPCMLGLLVAVVRCSPDYNAIPCHVFPLLLLTSCFLDGRVPYLHKVTIDLIDAQLKFNCLKLALVLWLCVRQLT